MHHKGQYLLKFIVTQLFKVVKGHLLFHFIPLLGHKLIQIEMNERRAHLWTVLNSNIHDLEKWAMACKNSTLRGKSSLHYITHDSCLEYCRHWHYGMSWCGQTDSERQTCFCVTQLNWEVSRNVSTVWLSHSSSKGKWFLYWGQEQLGILKQYTLNTGTTGWPRRTIFFSFHAFGCNNFCS